MTDMAQWTEVYRDMVRDMVKESDPRPSGPLEVLSWPTREIKGIILDVDVLRYGERGDTKSLLEDVASRFGVVVTAGYSKDMLIGELRQLGLLDLVLDGKIGIRGIDETGVVGRTPEFYGSAAVEFGLSPRECLAVVEDFDRSGFSAIGAGMGSMVITRADGLRQLLGNELAEGHVLAKKFDVEGYLRSKYKPGEVTIIGIVGRNAAGKSATAERMVRMGQEMGLPTIRLTIEAFHIRSRKERTAWLAEGRDTGLGEYARRFDRYNWFDWEMMQKALETLKAKQSLHLEGIYDQSQGGEKVGTLDIPIDSVRGAVVIFEGTEIDNMSDFMDDVIFITAHPNNRLERLFERDSKARSMEQVTDSLRFYTYCDVKRLSVQRDRVTRVLANDEGDLVELPLLIPWL